MFHKLTKNSLISAKCSFIKITKFATANTTAAITPVINAGAPRITAPTAAKAMPIPIKISLITEKPFLNISTKFLTAITTPLRIAPTAEIFLIVSIDAIKKAFRFLITVIIVLTPLTIFGVIDIIVPIADMVLPIIISSGPIAATTKETVSIISLTGVGSLFKKSTRF